MANELGGYSDAELFEFLRERSEMTEKAFQELYSRHSPRVYAYCKRFLGNKEEAQDVLQETFVKLFQSAEQDRDMTNLPAFVLRIARNMCVNVKKSEREHTTFEDYMVYDDTEHDEKDKHELLDLIQKALKQLPDDYREVFVLREYNGLAYADIADVTNTSLATVKIKIFRAKQKIREALAPYLQEIKN